MHGGSPGVGFGPYRHGDGSDLVASLLLLGDILLSRVFEIDGNLTDVVKNKVGATIVSQYDYSSDGNMTAMPSATGEWTLAWNAENQLVSVAKTTPGDGDLKLEFAYDYLDASGTTVAHYEYSPFGELTAASGSKTADFPHRFSTKYFDALVPSSTTKALYYYGLRYYSPGIG